MVNKKDLVIVALATFCLTATLFMVKPIGSQSQVGLSPAGTYDSWVDLNDDGIIDIYDAILFSNHFDTTGDPAKNVNVTKTPGMTIQEDLNISTSPSGYGDATTDVFATAGFDRIFVSAAIIDVSNYPLSYVNVSLTKVKWRWGIVNGTYMETYAPIDDPSRQLSISVWNTSDIPVSSGSSAEFAVQAAQCRLEFRGGTYPSSDWILLRVSVYLTVGTSSTPTVQNTYVTNMPYQQPKPAYDTNYAFFRTPLGFGTLTNSTWINVGGYSRIFVGITIDNASYFGVSAQTTVSLYLVYWGEEGYESLPAGVLNVTYYGFSLPAYSIQIPPEFKTRGFGCYLYFSIDSAAIVGWVDWHASIYLRNE
jgi:hypothetical protein